VDATNFLPHPARQAELASAALRQIKALTRNDSTLSAMIRIGTECFGEKYGGDQLLSNWSNSDERTTFFGVFEDERLLAFNGFIAHPAYSGGKQRLLFQSCHSATDPEYRGQGLFSKIIEHAKQSLQGDYIVGYPNPQSHPIFVNRLGFEQEPQLSLWLSTIGAGLSYSAKRLADALADTKLCTINQREVARWKAVENPGAIVQFEFEGNFIWGRIRERKLGPIAIRYLDAGGCEAANVESFSSTLHKLGSALSVRAVRLLVTQTSSFAQAAKIKRALPGTFIWHRLHNAPEARFDAFRGMADFW
jgi:hypothetical protein